MQESLVFCSLVFFFFFVVVFLGGKMEINRNATLN